MESIWCNWDDRLKETGPDYWSRNGGRDESFIEGKGRLRIISIITLFVHPSSFNPTEIPNSAKITDPPRPQRKQTDKKKEEKKTKGIQ